VGDGVWGRPHLARALIRALAAEGLDAIEVFHPDHGPEQEERFRGLARELSLATTAGSDFHGVPEERKRPGGVYGDGAMLDSLRARRP
jgi:predicted metal-dependent phosphoesterase TrpH